MPFYTEPPTSDQYEVEKTSRVKILDFIINNVMKLPNTRLDRNG